MKRTTLMFKRSTPKAEVREKTFVGFVVLLGATAPLLYLFALRVPFFELAHEFIAFRIGSALSVIYNELDHIRPVQGLPNALLSQGIVRLIFPFLGSEIATLGGMQLYTALFFATSIATTVVIIAARWRWLGRIDVWRLALLALCPWYLEPIREVWIHGEVFAASRLSMMRIMARRMNAATVVA